MRPKLATRRRVVRNVDDELAMGECMEGRSKGGNPYVGTPKCRACAPVAHWPATFVGGGCWLAERRF